MPLTGELDASTLERIERLFDARRYAEVEALCTSLLADTPEDSRLLYHRAQARRLRGDTNGAISDLASAIAQNDREPALFYFRGVWNLDVSDFRSAEADFAAAVAKERTLGTSYYVESAQLARAITLLKLGDFSGAELACDPLRADQKTFLLGRQWTVIEVRSRAIARRPV